MCIRDRPGDLVIILSYVALEADDIAGHKPKIVIVNEDNQIQNIG